MRLGEEQEGFYMFRSIRRLVLLCLVKVSVWVVVVVRRARAFFRIFDLGLELRQQAVYRSLGHDAV